MLSDFNEPSQQNTTLSVIKEFTKLRGSFDITDLSATMSKLDFGGSFYSPKESKKKQIQVDDLKRKRMNQTHRKLSQVVDKKVKHKSTDKVCV